MGVQSGWRKRGGRDVSEVNGVRKERVLERGRRIKGKT